MKKIFCCITILLLILIIPNVYAENNLSINSIKLVEKSDNVLELSKPTINGMNLGFDLSFLNIGDYAKYEIEISNNSNKDYYIDNETTFNKSSYITYKYEFKEKIDKIEKNSKITMYITIKYTTIVPPEKLVNGMYTEENAMSMDLSDIILTNPNTYGNIIFILLVFISLILLTIIRLSKKKRITINIILIGLLLIPITTYALERITIKAQTKITIEEQRNYIESRYINYNLSVERDFWQYSNYIKTVTFKTKIEEPSNYIYKFDVSEAKNNSIIAYLLQNEENNTFFDLYLMSNGYIYANPDSSFVFKEFKNLNIINDIEKYKTNYVYNMESMFSRLYSIEELDLSSFDTSNVTNMQNMFNTIVGSGGQGILKKLDVSNFDTSNVFDMVGMFSGLRELEELDVSSFDTSNVDKLNNMFNGCESLQILDLRSFDVSNVSNMENLFATCFSLKVVDLSSFDTSNVVNMSSMFREDRNLEKIYVSNKWNIENIINSNQMFSFCNKLPNFDSNVTDKTNANTSDTGYLTLKS